MLHCKAPSTGDGRRGPITGHSRRPARRGSKVSDGFFQLRPAPRRPRPPSVAARPRPRRANTRRSYSGAFRRLDAWLDGRPLEDAVTYLAELHDQGRAPSSSSTAVAAARFRARLAGDADPGRGTDRPGAGRRTAAGPRAAARRARSWRWPWPRSSPPATGSDVAADEVALKRGSPCGPTYPVSRASPAGCRAPGTGGHRRVALGQPHLSCRQRELPRTSFHPLRPRVRAALSLRDAAARAGAGLPARATKTACSASERTEPPCRTAADLVAADATPRFTEAFKHLRTGEPSRDRIGLLNVLLAEAVGARPPGAWSAGEHPARLCSPARMRAAPGACPTAEFAGGRGACPPEVRWQTAPSGPKSVTASASDSTPDDQVGGDLDVAVPRSGT